MSINSHCIFIHGSHHGAWCWRDLDKTFELKNLTKHYIDLPGHGKRVGEQAHYSLDDYVNSVVNYIKSLDAPVSLVGHSFGGVVISQVAEVIPERIHNLIYLCAFMLPSGYTASSVIQASGFIAPLDEGLIVDMQGDCMRISEDTARKYTYNLCTEDQIQYALKNFCDEPLAPTMEKLKISDERHGTIKRFYIKCNHDLSILPALQDYMVQKVGVHRSYELAADHSPFFSNPSKLSEILLTCLTQSK